MNLKDYIRSSIKEYITVFKDQFAMMSGNRNKNFEVKTPSSDYHATNYKFLQDYYSAKSHNHDSSYATKSHDHSKSDVNGLVDSLDALELAYARTFFVVGRSEFWVDDTDREFGDSWADGWITPTFYGSSSTIYVDVNYNLPTRNNDGGGWGGVGIALYYSKDNGDWTWIGQDTWGGNVMALSTQIIGSYSNSFRLHFSSGFSSLKFKFVHKAYSGTAWVNKNTGTLGNMLSSMKVIDYRRKS